MHGGRSETTPMGTKRPVQTLVVRHRLSAGETGIDDFLGPGSFAATAIAYPFDKR